MYLTNSSDAASRRSVIMKHGNQEIRVNAEMVKFAAKQLRCTESDIYKCMEGEEEIKNKTALNIFDRAKNLKEMNKNYG